ncbi:MAG: tetratricopeptide repeat protein, partial [Proteobacteria bacterium]|nr:tetratricopeptide repeat protein [Pseudomonadota bacterium]
DFLGTKDADLPTLSAIHPEVGWLAIATARVLDQQGQSTQAIKTLQKAAVLSPHLAGVHYELGIMLLRFEGQHQGAAAAFQASSRLKPSDPASWYGLGQAWMQHSGREEDAQHAFRNTIEVAQGHPDWVGLGRLALEGAGGTP